MNKFLNAAASVLFIFINCSFAETFVDPRDNRKYSVVKVGDQHWLAENLNIKLPKSSCYDKSISCDKNGRLYKWEVAMDACPDGWSVPTDEDWKAALKVAGSWKGLQRMGVQIPMAGDMRADGAYHYLGESAFYWSSTPSKNKFVRYRFNANSEETDRAEMVDGPAYSLKCIRGKKSCRTPLFNAIRSGNVSKVSSLIAAGAHVNAACTAGDESEMTSMGCDYEYISPLALAIDKENVEIVRLLLDNGADANAVDESGPSEEQYSMLIRAFSKNNFDIVKLLLDHSAKIDACDIDLTSWDNKETLLLYVLDRMDVRDLNTCIMGGAILDLFKDKPDVYKKMKSLGAKSGEEACASIEYDEEGWPKPGSNWAMCGD